MASDCLPTRLNKFKERTMWKPMRDSWELPKEKYIIGGDSG